MQQSATRHPTAATTEPTHTANVAYRSPKSESAAAQFGRRGAYASRLRFAANHERLRASKNDHRGSRISFLKFHYVHPAEVSYDPTMYSVSSL